MKKYKVTIHVFIKPAVLNTAEGPVLRQLHDLGFGTVSKIRMGKCFLLELEAKDEAEAREIARRACADKNSSFLVNPVVENFEIVEVVEAAATAATSTK